MGASVPRFDDEQRDLLTSLGVNERQIERLSLWLPNCRHLLEPSATMSEVREEIEGLAALLDESFLALQRWLPDDPGQNVGNAIGEARVRVGTAADELLGCRSAILDAKESTLRALKALRGAGEVLPKAQRRSIQADPFPVCVVDVILSCGQNAGHRATDYRFPSSASVTSPFYRIVTAFYLAMLRGRVRSGYSPERAVKAFMKENRENPGRAEQEFERVAAMVRNSDLFVA